MAPPVLPDSTTVVPTETHGLPGEDDKIVRELDVYLLQGELGQGTQARRAAAAAAVLPGGCGALPAYRSFAAFSRHPWQHA